MFGLSMPRGEEIWWHPGRPRELQRDRKGRQCMPKIPTGVIYGGKMDEHGDKTSNFKIFLGSLCMDIAARKLSGFLSLHCMTKHCRSYGDEILQNNTLLSMARDAQLQVVAGRCKVFQCFSGQYGYLFVEI